jgi:murein tripeptide amidase MpaA
MKNIIIAAILILLSLPLLAVEWNQYYFRFNISSRSEISLLTNVVSIDNVQGNTVWAYANDSEWEAFQRLGYTAELLPAPSSLLAPVMRSAGETSRLWDTYPTYEAYVAQMNAFAANYPNLCQIVDAGTTMGGRHIYFAKISDNISTHEAEPEVLYTAAMHGDETTGYILMLRLIDYLLTNYATDTRVQNMVNNMEIWINPNANPDGTYYGGNSTVTGARRYNNNGIDINRSFPDPWGGATSPVQTETTLMMNLANAHHFALSCNFHGGAEVVNYPWDSIPNQHVDNNWYFSISQAYASTVHAVSPSTYMDDLNNGVTNGYAWYEVNGGRQDWYNYYRQCRELCIELTTTKMPAGSLLPTYWDYNYNALLGLLENSLYGLHGVVTNALGQPLDATINIVGVDDANSKATTDPVNGDYYRFLSPGTYTVEISTSGYTTQTFSNVVISAGQKTTLNAVFGIVTPTLSIPLTTGWNCISLNVLPADLTLPNVFAGVSANLLQVKDASLSYAPGVNSYFNTLGSLVTGKGYWVNMSAPATLSVTAPAVNTTATAISLNQGWNLVAYLPQAASAVSSALTSVSAYLQEVRYLDTFYIPGGGGNTLSTMSPGKGYWIKVSQACTLTYP